MSAVNNAVVVSDPVSLILHMAGLGRENGQVHVNSRCVYRSNGAMQQW